MWKKYRYLHCQLTLLDSLCTYIIQHCFIRRPSDSTVSEDAGIEPRTVASLALARSHPHRTAVLAEWFLSNIKLMEDIYNNTKFISRMRSIMNILRPVYWGRECKYFRTPRKQQQHHVAHGAFHKAFVFPMFTAKISMLCCGSWFLWYLNSLMRMRIRESFWPWIRYGKNSDPG
jgi:hypothetical protein